jgi:hypothetical protein
MDEGAAQWRTLSPILMSIWSITMKNLKQLVAIVSLLLIGLIPALAQTDDVPHREVVDTVSAFYNWYLAYIAPDETGHVNNPLVDGAYRDSPYLTEAFIERIDAQLEGEHIIADPFLCAQDVPESFEVQVIEWYSSVATTMCTAEQSCQAVDVMPRRAVVLLRQFFAGNPQSYNITVRLVAADEDWRLSNVICEDTITPAGATRAFYDWYLAYTAPDETGHFNNPLVDKAYRRAPYLSVELVEKMDELLSEEPIMYDPFVCAQDVPEWYRTEEIEIRADSAQVMVMTYFPEFPGRLLVSLENSANGWDLVDIACQVSPEAITVGFYNLYLAHVDYHPRHGGGHSPLTGYDWRPFLNEALYEELAGRLAAVERTADPVLCAQDIPERIQVERQETSEERVTLLVRGDYPAGPDTYTSYDLAIAELRLFNRQWALTGLRCVP